MTTWYPVRAEEAKTCEAIFQSGGPRVVIFSGGRWLWSDHSAHQTVRYARPGDVVYRRRKLHLQNKYEWVKQHVAG